MAIISISSAEVQYLRERDWRLSRLISHIGTFELSKAESAFQCVAHSIIEQMLSMKAASKIEERIRDLCQGDIAPDRVALQPVEKLKACGISMRKAKSLHDFAEYASHHDLELLTAKSEDEIRSELLARPGIGKWTCDMFLIFYLGLPDILPVEDGALRQAFRWLYGAEISSPGVQEVICSLWRPYSSTAVCYLYHALNIGLVKSGTSPVGLLW